MDDAVRTATPAPASRSRSRPEVACSNCEAVCCRLTVVLMPHDDVPHWLVQEDPRGPDTMAKGDDGWCIALDRDRMCCSIYSQRPQVCRDFSMGGAYCRSERADWARGLRRATTGGPGGT